MGKGKKKGASGGLSGVSRFVFAGMNEAPANQDRTPSVGSDGALVKDSREDTSLPEKSAPSSRTVSWIAKYDCTGLVPHYSSDEQVPEHLQKYFSQRLRYFALYSTIPGCLLDEEGWYSVTPELVADQIAERCRCDTVLDAFCGVGGNAIAFAKRCQRVIALDTSATRLMLARHNAQIYGVADRIEFIHCDYRTFVRSYLRLPSSLSSTEKRKIDVVFLSPPWGGPSYLDGNDLTTNGYPATTDATHPSYSLSTVKPVHGARIFDLARKITKNVAYYLPRNTHLDEVSALLTEERQRAGMGEGATTESQVVERVEVEEEWMGNKLKAITCYFGGLVQGQEDMF